MKLHTCSIVVIGTASLLMAGKPVDHLGCLLTVEQAGILKHFSLVDLPIDDAGNTAPAIRISGINVQIVNGEGLTETNNALGNLIVGYNEFDKGSDNERTGSHNLVGGNKNSYHNYGGLVTGERNTLVGRFSAMTGGEQGIASGAYSVVAGGRQGDASGLGAVVVSGRANMAQGPFAVTVSGDCNRAGGGVAVTIGGRQNTALGGSSSTFGGWNNLARGSDAVTLGGGGPSQEDGNQADSFLTTIVGGKSNFASGRNASITGGSFNVAGGDQSTVSGGYKRAANGVDDWVAGSLFEDF